MRSKLFLTIFIILFGINFQAVAKNDQAIPLAFIDRDVIISEAISVKSIRTQLDEKKEQSYKRFCSKRRRIT